MYTWTALTVVKMHLNNIAIDPSLNISSGRFKGVPPPPHILQNLQKFKIYSVSGTSINFSLHSLFTPPYSTPLIQFPFLTHSPPPLFTSPPYSFPLLFTLSLVHPTPPLLTCLLSTPSPLFTSPLTHSPLFIHTPLFIPSPFYSLYPPLPLLTPPLFTLFLIQPTPPPTHASLIHSFSYPPHPSSLLTPSLFTPLPLIYSPPA